MKNPSMKRLYILAGEYINNKCDEPKLGRPSSKTKIAVEKIFDFLRYVFDKQSEAKWRKKSLKVKDIDKIKHKF